MDGRVTGEEKDGCENDDKAREAVRFFQPGAVSKNLSRSSVKQVGEDPLSMTGVCAKPHWD